jgi:tetratricopeptide (TPR) repeat protein
MKRICTVMIFILLGRVLADLPKEKVNADIGQLMAKQRYEDVEAYIETNRIEALKTNLVFQGILSVRRGRAKEAIVFLERYLEGAANREQAFEEVNRVGVDIPEVARHLRELGVSKYGLRLPTAVEVETQLEQVLAGEDVDQMIAGLDAKRSLIALDPKTAYSEIRTASLRHMNLAARPEHPVHYTREQKQRHGLISEALYRYLQRIDESTYASVEGQCQLAAILHTRGEYGPALQILTTLRELKGAELEARKGQIELLIAVCLEESGMRDRAKELYGQIIDHRNEARYSGYAEAAQDRLTAMTVLETRTSDQVDSKRGKLAMFLGSSAIVAAGLGLIMWVNRRRGIIGSGAGLAFVLGSNWMMTGIEVQAATISTSAASAPAVVGFPAFLTNRVELGKVKGSLTKFEWKPVLEAADTVVRVRASCGCTAVGVKEGDRLQPQQGIPMEIKLSGKHGGLHEESVLLELGSGGALILQFAFSYEPTPYVSNQYVLFWPGSYSRTVMVRTFGMPKVGIRNLSTNGPVSIRKKRDTEDGIELDLTLDRSVKESVRKGVVDLEIEAGGRYTNSIPFAVLSAAP